MAQDEEETIARLQQWWQENWKALVGGLVIGIGGIVGWNLWQSAAETRAMAASENYRQMIVALDAGNVEAARAVRDELVADYSGTPYAASSSLLLAARSVREDDLDAAAELLEWTRSKADDPAMRQLARLRLARVRWAQGDADAALQLINSDDQGSFVAAFEELRGDILVAQDDREGAFDAYVRAFAQTPQEARELLQQKMDDLADVARDDAPATDADA